MLSNNRKENMLKLVVSPLLALYGLTPIYLFSRIPFNNMAFSYVSLTAMIILFWMGNERLFRSSLPEWSRYIISYGVSLAIHIGILLFTPLLQGAQQSASFIIYPLVSTLAINSIIIVIIRMQLLRRDRDTVELELGRVKLENLEAQKRTLIQQLQPHFLFNALSTLKSLIPVDDVKAVQYTLSLSEFLRYTNQVTTSDKVTVNDELRFTRDYLDLQGTRFGSSLQCTIDVDETILKCHVPVFAIQSLVENAIKHNALSERKPLLVSVRSEAGCILVSNPRQPKPLQVSSGTGLQNLANRYLLMFNRSIEVLDDENTFTVRIPVLCP